MSIVDALGEVQWKERRTNLLPHLVCQYFDMHPVLGYLDLPYALRCCCSDFAPTAYSYFRPVGCDRWCPTAPCLVSVFRVPQYTVTVEFGKAGIWQRYTH